MKKLVWVIDDDPIYQIIANKIIKRSEMFSDAFTFTNGKEAIDALHSILKKKESLPDLILLDINMPIMDGWEFVEELRVVKFNFNKSVFIYIVSSSISLSDKYRSKTYPEIVGYLSKPISTDDLVLIASNY